MKLLRSLLAAALLALGLVAPMALVTGCKATPQQVAYKSADAVVSSVDIAMQGWADYVVAERRRIAALPQADQLGPKSDLLRKEGRVATAYGRYQQACETAREAVNVAIAQNQPLPSAVSAAASIVLDVIKSNR